MKKTNKPNNLSLDWNSSNSLSIGEKPPHAGRLLVCERIPAVDVNEPRLASRKSHTTCMTRSPGVFLAQRIEFVYGVRCRIEAIVHCRY